MQGFPSTHLQAQLVNLKPTCHLQQFLDPVALYVARGTCIQCRRYAMLNETSTMNGKPPITEHVEQLTAHHQFATCTPDLFLQGKSQIFDSYKRSGMDLLHPQQMRMCSFMSS